MSKTGPTTDIIFGMRARRRFTADEKLRIVEESLSPENSISATARKYAIHPAQLYTWRKLISQKPLHGLEDFK